jgi:prepilin-type N-terminal cleavage/methylation domain-containing protein
MKNAFKLNSNLPPLSLPLKGGEATSSINLLLSGGEQKRGLFKNRDSQSAFTLVELAIVLVIVGLITVGVVGGQSIIYTANVNSTIAQMREYNTALNAFKLEFDGIPGDFDEAVEYGIDRDSSGTVNTCTTGTGTTLNGDDDGLLESRSSVNFRYYGEVGNFFPHMQNAGLINEAMRTKTLTCVVSGIRNVGDDYPASKIGTSLIALSDESNKKIYYVIGLLEEVKNGLYIVTPASLDDMLTPKEASDIDKKVDDGNPLKGLAKVIQRYRGIYNIGTIEVDEVDNSTNCVYNSAYNVGYDEEACTLAIEAGRF